MTGLLRGSTWTGTLPAGMDALSLRGALRPGKPSAWGAAPQTGGGGSSRALTVAVQRDHVTRNIATLAPAERPGRSSRPRRGPRRPGGGCDRLEARPGGRVASALGLRGALKRNVSGVFGLD